MQWETARYFGVGRSQQVNFFCFIKLSSSNANHMMETIMDMKVRRILALLSCFVSLGFATISESDYNIPNEALPSEDCDLILASYSGIHKGEISSI